MISKTKINERMRNKTNKELAKAIFLAKKKGLVEIAAAISVPTRQQVNLNLEDLNKSDVEEIIIPGKVLGTGEIKKKLKVYAMGFSDAAKEKLKKAGCEANTILEVLSSNKNIKGKILR